MAGCARNVSTIWRLLSASALSLLAGCAGVQMPSLPGTPTTSVPDYSLTADQYSQVQFEVVASEFRDTLSGKYVHFDAQYMGLQDTVIVKAKGQLRAGVSPELSSARLFRPGASGSALVIWPKEDRQAAIPFVSMPPGTPVRIYAYIISTGATWRLRSASRYSPGYGEPLVLLMSVEKLSETQSGKQVSGGEVATTAATFSVQTSAAPASRGVPATPGSSHISGAELIRSIQAALKSAGFYSGAIDGELGPKTRAAIQQYQKASGQDVNGVPTQELLRALNRK